MGCCADELCSTLQRVSYEYKKKAIQEPLFIAAKKFRDWKVLTMSNQSLSCSTLNGTLYGPGCNLLAHSHTCWGVQFKSNDPCSRGASPTRTLPPASLVLGPVPGCCETGDNLAALGGPFLGAGIRAWLFGLCSWSRLLLHCPCGKTRGQCAAFLVFLPGGMKSLRLSTAFHSASPFPICWGHQDMQSGLISRLNTLSMQVIGILWRPGFVFYLLKTSLSHWTGIPFSCPTGNYLFLPPFHKRKGQKGRGGLTLQLQNAQGSLGKTFILVMFVLTWAELFWAGGLCLWWEGQCWSLNSSVSAVGAGQGKPTPCTPNQLQMQRRMRFESLCIDYVPCEP